MKLGPIEIDSGYALLIIAGLAVWIGVPVVNAVFGTNVMTGIISIPLLGNFFQNEVFGGGMVLLGILAYLRFFFGL